MRTLRIISTVVLGLAIVCTAYPKVIRVPGDCLTIQDGIDEAVDGDKVLVATGIYKENIDFKGKAIVLASESGPLHTTIRGTGIGDAVMGATGSTIRGFTITGAVVSGEYGINAMLSTMTIQANIITGNSGGIFTANYRKPRIENNLIYNNTQNGINAQFYAEPIIVNNTIAFNGYHGIFSASATGVVVNNVIYTNGKNGIYCGAPSPDISTNNVFGNKMANYWGCVPGPGDISEDPQFVDAPGGNRGAAPRRRQRGNSRDSGP